MMIGFRRFGAVVGVALAGLVISNGMLMAADPPHKTADGLDVYLRIVPAEMVRDRASAERQKPGIDPRASHEFHVLAAIFDAATRARISDARVAAKVSNPTLSGVEKTLEPVEIAGNTAYGGFFELPNSEPYTVTLTIERPSAERPIVFDFKYDPRC
jgi:hypothetical protein